MTKRSTASIKENDKITKETRTLRKKLFGELGLNKLPGFKESLKLLAEREEYSITDIGMMFGVSRERVRQLEHKFKIKNGTCIERVWDDKSNRFIPVGAKGKRQIISNRKEKQDDLENYQRRERIRKILNTLTQELNRQPKWDELALAVFGKIYLNSCIAVIGYYCKGTSISKTKDKLSFFIDTAGWNKIEAGKYKRYKRKGDNI